MKKEKQKIKHIWSILCKSSSTDSQSNSLSLFNTIEQINVTPALEERKKIEEGVEKVISVSFPFELITLWKKTVENEKADAEVEIELFDPKGKSVTKVPYTLSIPQDKKRMRFRAGFMGLNIPMGGEYSFKVRIKEQGCSTFEEVVDLPLDVVIKTPVRG